MDYKNAGVDIEAGYKSVELMKEHVKKTMRPEVLGGLGGFSGAFSLAKIKEMEEPVLLSGTDGCGTKVKLAMILDKHDTIGIDAVAMCVNDIACAGGEPLFFLDYIACGKNYPEKIASIVKGVAEGCLQSDAALIGGETAEHPGLMPEDEYDLAGFAVGVCDKKDMITGENLAVSDTTVTAADGMDGINSVYVVRQIVDAVRVNLTEEVRTIEVALTPEHLGKVNITVASKNGILTASMVVQNEMVKNAIENQLTMLKTQFESQGIKVEHVEVTVASHEFDSDMQDGADDRNNTKSGARRKFRGIDELTDDKSDIIDEQNGFTESSINIKA